MNPLETSLVMPQIESEVENNTRLYNSLVDSIEKSVPVSEPGIETVGMFSVTPSAGPVLTRAAGATGQALTRAADSDGAVIAGTIGASVAAGAYIVTHGEEPAHQLGRTVAPYVPTSFGVHLGPFHASYVTTNGEVLER